MSGTRRRRPRKTIDTKLLQHQRALAGVTQGVLALRVGIRVDYFGRIERREKMANEELALKIDHALRALWGESETIKASGLTYKSIFLPFTPESVAGASSSAQQERATSRIPSAPPGTVPKRSSARELGIKYQRNQITDKTITRRLLAGRPPSMLACVKKTESCLLRESERVDKHFFGVSTLLLVKSSAFRKPQLLEYSRILDAGEPGSWERQGASILFHTSYDIHVHKGRVPMDSWVELADENEKAAKEKFVQIPRGTFFELLNVYKLKLPEVDGRCVPFGVITRDLREKEKIVYTQFVFQTTLSLPGTMEPDDLDARVASFHTKNIKAIWRVKHLDPNFFLTSSASPKFMDYFAACAYLGKKAKPRKDVRFTRGFDIV